MANLLKIVQINDKEFPETRRQAPQTQFVLIHIPIPNLQLYLNPPVRLSAGIK
jgi:hypothetical protein